VDYEAEPEGVDIDVDVDVEEMERRYAAERAKRIRSDAVDQFQKPKGRFSRFGEDPYGDPDFTRDPVVEDIDVAIIGAGFAGMMVGARLRERGIDNFRIIDKAGDFGGTWYWNRYPGAACDVEAYIYLPMLEELDYIPTEKYAKAPEIHAHAHRLAKHFRLGEGALFQTGVEKTIWNEARKRWIVHTDRGDRIAARFLVSCAGLLSMPKLPAIPGIESFEGHSFHTSRWDYDYTGGDSYGNLTGLDDKVVGIIGTGSTGIQSIPLLAQSAKHLYVFQRTPSTIDRRGNRPTDPAWAQSLKPGWHRERGENFNAVTAGRPQPVDMIDDGWTEIIKAIQLPGFGEVDADQAAQLKLAEMRKMEQTRRRIGETVKDPATAEALKPYYHYFCKRPCFHDEYLDTFNRPNVTLVDTQGKGVDRITADALVVDGREYRVDCLIYATGFEYMADYVREYEIEIIGANGLPLEQAWADGTRTLFGIQSHGFPNMLLMSTAQSGSTINYMFGANERSQHIAYLIGTSIERGIETIQPTLEAQDGWVAEVLRAARPRHDFLASCTPGNFNFEGKLNERNILNSTYFGQAIDYFAMLQKFRDSGDLPGLAITYPSSPG
jgi:cyclohexanone monooxygenase